MAQVQQQQQPQQTAQQPQQQQQPVPGQQISSQGNDQAAQNVQRQQIQAPVTNETPEQIIARYGSKSQAIRGLALEGWPRSHIAKALNIRYQHVRNVLITPVKAPIQKFVPTGGTTEHIGQLPNQGAAKSDVERGSPQAFENAQQASTDPTRGDDGARSGQSSGQPVAQQQQQQNQEQEPKQTSGQQSGGQPRKR